MDDAPLDSSSPLPRTPEPSTKEGHEPYTLQPLMVLKIPQDVQAHGERGFGSRCRGGVGILALFGGRPAHPPTPARLQDCAQASTSV